LFGCVSEEGGGGGGKREGLVVLVRPNVVLFELITTVRRTPLVRKVKGALVEFAKRYFFDFFFKNDGVLSPPFFFFSFLSDFSLVFFDDT
jgi:hypothetical protein